MAFAASATEGKAASSSAFSHFGLRPATEQPKNRPKQAPKPLLLRQSALSAFELLESGSREPRG